MTRIGLTTAVTLALATSLPTFAAAETIDVAIGHQSMCTDTYTAGIVIKELGLFEKYLPKDGKYADVDYDISWSDYSSGGPITNQMLANKLNFGVMGDYPLIVNGANFQATDSLRTLYVAGTGYNLKGSGNAIVVPVNLGGQVEPPVPPHQLNEVGRKVSAQSQARRTESIVVLGHRPVQDPQHRQVSFESSGPRSVPLFTARGAGPPASDGVLRR